MGSDFEEEFNLNGENVDVDGQAADLPSKSSMTPTNESTVFVVIWNSVGKCDHNDRMKRAHSSSYELLYELIIWQVSSSISAIVVVRYYCSTKKDNV